MGQIKVARALCYVMHDIGQDLEEQWWLMRQVLESIKRKRVRDQRPGVQQQSMQIITVEPGVGEIATPVDTERQKPVFFFPDVGKRRVSLSNHLGDYSTWYSAMSRTRCRRLGRIQTHRPQPHPGAEQVACEVQETSWLFHEATSARRLRKKLLRESALQDVGGRTAEAQQRKPCRLVQTPGAAKLEGDPPSVAKVLGAVRAADTAFMRKLEHILDRCAAETGGNTTCASDSQ